MGIVAGIGDLLNNKNLIRPKLDADIYNFIIGQNAIINGLQVIGNTLTAGTCLLKGYRGMLENDETLNGETYIYGKFTLNFNDGITDSFDILKTNSEPQDGTINPASITTNGIYYLLLYTYTNGAYVSNVETFGYPVKAQYSDEAKHLVSGGTIDIDVTAETLPVGTATNQIATCEFVDNEINAQIAADSYTGNFVAGNQQIIGTYTLRRKAKYVIGTARVNTDNVGTLAGIWATFPSGFKPKQSFYFGLYTKILNITDVRIMSCNSNGEVRTTTTTATAEDNDYTNTFGYETN